MSISKNRYISDIFCKNYVHEMCAKHNITKVKNRHMYDTYCKINILVIKL